jgi:uncharacterized membrane protein YkvA (DUF1232 family)
MADISWFARITNWAKRTRRDALALWFVARDPATPLWLRAFLWFVVAYALSPIDLIPDFIPVLGYVDEAILLPLAIWFAVRHIPGPQMADARERAGQVSAKPRSWSGAIIIVLLWFALAWLTWRIFWR